MDPTTETPTIPAQPTKIPRTPTTPQQRTVIYGIVAVSIATLALFLGGIHLFTNSDVKEADSKTRQVEACAKITEPNAAFLCVEQVDD